MSGACEAEPIVPSSQPFDRRQCCQHHHGLADDLAADELKIADRTDDNTKNEWLSSLVKRINEMVRFQEISLDVIFAAPLKAVTPPPQDGANGSDQAA